MNGAKLVRMANDIAAFFAAEPRREDAIAGVAGHLQRFWDPRMRRQILELLDAGGDGMHELVTAALHGHRDRLMPAPR
ncbi:MAG: formate dehydrogenase subunit delta [Planctomycetes bacterium]|nr:formate dehydrogenase subunit delta [Planctomycetota bacterium]